MKWWKCTALLAAIVLVGACGGGGSKNAVSTKSTTTTVRDAQTSVPASVAPETPAPTSTTAALRPTSESPQRAAGVAADPCAVAPQVAPPDELPANFATALAFAPDGRLFFAE